MNDHNVPSRPLRQRNIFNGSGRFGPNMTPMVDVVLVILIFFMAATTIAGQEWFLQTDLPERLDEEATQSGFDLPTPMLDLELFVVDASVMVRGLGGDPVGLDTAVSRLEAMDSAMSAGLILRLGASDDVPYGAMVAVQDAGNAAGMKLAIR
jgi:biopolymer transport protein ExbD